MCEFMKDAAERSDLRIALPPFTRHGYRRLIEGFLDAGYTPATFETVRRECRDVIMRHDVDVSLEAAVSIAELEHEMGVRATYFVMVSNSFYNVFSREGRRMVARIAELGHCVGLHVDVSLYPTSSDILAACSPAIAKEFQLLAAVVDDPIELISLHNPRPELVNRERSRGGRSHTYEPRFFSDLAYVADFGRELALRRAVRAGRVQERHRDPPVDAPDLVGSRPSHRTAGADLGEICRGIPATGAGQPVAEFQRLSRIREMPRL